MKYLKFVTFIIACSLILVTCKKDDEETLIVETGTLTIDGTQYSIGHGEILRFEHLYGGVYYAPIYLMSSEFSFGETGIYGNGQLVEMVVFTDSETEITSGQYTVAVGENYQAGTFIFGLFQDMQGDTWEISGFYQAASGTMEVSKSGSAYTMNINVLADKYDIEMAGEEPEGDPVETDVPITCTVTGDLKQTYFE